MDILLRPLGWAYTMGTDFRNHSFDQGWRKTHKLSKPVVSVGNITLGGTGKTPIVSHLIGWALSKQLKPGMITRGYGGKVRGVEKLREGVGAAKHYGDEPSMLHYRHPTVPIYVSPDRVAAGERLILNEEVDLLIADDAFQHRRLHRDVDIVVLDVMEPIRNYRVVPEGRLRERVESLARADFVIVNKVNLVEPDEYERIVEAFGLAGMKWAPMEYDLGPIDTASDYLLVTGVGRPKSVTALLEKKRVVIKKHLKFADHHPYSARDVAKILKEAGSMKVLTTEKDATKLRSFASLKDKLVVAKLEVRPDKAIGSLYDAILSQLP